MKHHLLTAAILAAGTTVAVGQTVTVSKSGTPDFGTIADAIASFTPDPDPGTPNVIEILDDEVYDEALDIRVPLTIEGVGADRPILVLQSASYQVPGDTSPDGLVIDLESESGTVELRNLIMIPSATATPQDDLLRTANSDTNALTLILDNILITSNDGSNAPVTLDGLALEDMTGAIPINDDGMFLAGTGLVVEMTDVVVSHALNGVTTNQDGLVLSSAIESVLIGDGCVFSYNGRLGIQATAAESFVVDAPNNRVIVTGNQGFAGVWFSTAQTVERSINGMNIVNNNGFGIEHQNRGTVEAEFSNMIIANNGGHGFLVGSVGTGGGILSDVTVANNGGEAVNISSGSAGDFSFTDSIIGGQAGNGSILHAGSGTLTLNNSAAILSGVYRLAGSGFSGSGTVVQNDVINDNPNFNQTVDFTDEVTFYQVTAPSYEEAATAGAELKGGGTYELVLPTTSTNESWNLYR